MLARNSLAKASSLKKLAPVSTRAFSSGEFFPGIPKIQVRGGYFVPSCPPPATGRPARAHGAKGWGLPVVGVAQYDPDSKPSDMTFKYYNADEVRNATHRGPVGCRCNASRSTEP
jgi:hypothetical protein